MRKLLVSAVALGLIVGSVVAASAASDPFGKQVRGSAGAAKITRIEQRLIRTAETNGSVRILVSMPNATKQLGVLSSLEGTDADVLIQYDAFPILLVEADAAVVTDLASDPRVTGMQQDVAEPPTLASTIPLINADDMHTLGFDGTGTAVAILDTGIDEDHPFFAGRIVAEACFSNAAGAGGNVTLCPNGLSSQTGPGAANAETAACGPGNLCEHGSHVAGISAGNANGVATPGAPGDGVAPAAGIVAIQVFTRFNAPADCGGSAPCVASFTSDQILGLQQVATLAGGLPLVSANMSLGGGTFSSNCDAAQAPRKAAIDALLALNIATVIAAGNNGALNAVSAPGCISTAVTVGATNDADAVAGFSNRGPLLDLFAPGVSVDSSIPNDTYANFNGTSMAAPHVAGAWAVLREAFPSESVAQILTRLQTTGVPITYSTGVGSATTPRIDLLAAYGSSPATCPVDVVADGSFEGGIPNPSWVEASTNFGTPLCTAGSCGTGGGTAGPRTGAVWGWFGGTTAPAEVGSLEQVVAIPPGQATLEFYLWNGFTGGVGTDLNAKIDGNVVFTDLEGTPPYTSGYMLVSVDVTAYADGGAHTLRFDSTKPAGHNTNFSLDDVSLCVTPTGGGGGAPTLSVVKVGSGAGTVKSTPPGISCPPDCSEPFAPDTVVRLTATPATGSSFTAWGGGCTGTGVCQLVMSTGVNQIVSAWFDPSTSPPPVPGSDLSVTGTASADPQVGSPLTYTFTASNAGPDGAAGVSLAGTLPANAIPAASASAATGCTITGTDFICAIGSLANGASAEVTLQVTPYRAGTLTVSATVSSSGTDPNAANDSTSVDATVALVCTISGTPGDDVLTGTPGIDVICAKAGDDKVTAKAGNDVVMGGPGVDNLGGGEGDDLLKGGPGPDQLKGGPGTDTCEGGGGENTFLACES